MTQDFNPPYGVPVALADGLSRIVAPNPSPMTFKGTNTFILGKTDLAIIDPGPDNAEHLKAILQAVRSKQKITHIIVTHSHLDHSPLAASLSKATGAPVLAFGGSTAGRSKVMQGLAANGFTSGGEGIDTSFQPHIHVQDAQKIEGNGWSLDVIHTPGHLGNHICLGWGEECFTADHVMGWASSLVSPPDGDLTDFMTSCRRLNKREWKRFHPGHGDVITTPRARLDWLISHRQGREDSILKALENGPADAACITELVYSETPKSLRPAAMRNVLAHLIDLHGKSKVIAKSTVNLTTRFELTAETDQ